MFSVLSCPKCPSNSRLPLSPQSERLLTCVSCRAEYHIESPGIAHVMPSDELRRVFAAHEEHWNALPEADYEQSCRQVGTTLDAIDAVHLAYCRGEVLEVGCGSGRFLTKLTDRPGIRDITGLDVSLTMLRRAAVKGCHQLVHSPAESLPFLSGSFDTVVSTWSALKYVDRQKGFPEIHRVLRTKGILTFDLLNHWPYLIDHVWQEYLSQYRWPPRELWKSEYILSSNMKDARGEVELLERTGFRLLEMRSVQYLPFIRRRMKSLGYWNGYWGSRFGYDTVFVCEKVG
jgi:ubiquinone/menaquinone biosynthesis C-methylase UbiE